MTERAQAQNDKPGPGRAPVRRPATSRAELIERVAADPGTFTEAFVSLLQHLRDVEGLELCERGKAGRGGEALWPTSMADEQLAHKYVEHLLRERQAGPDPAGGA